MKRATATQSSLFEVVEREDEKIQAAAGNCNHARERKTETIWPQYPNEPRMTFTCEVCGRIRGRCSS